MLDAITGISLSGMEAAQTRLAVTAHNISNMNTDGFKASETRDVEQPDGRGVRATVVTPDTPGPARWADNGGARRASNTDVGHEAGQLILAQRAYEANLNVLKITNDLQKETLNLLV